MSALKFVFGRIARLSVVCSALLVFYCFYQFMVNKAYYNYSALRNGYDSISLLSGKLYVNE